MSIMIIIGMVMVNNHYDYCKEVQYVDNKSSGFHNGVQDTAPQTNA